jgi:hypothetical protein
LHKNANSFIFRFRILELEFPYMRALAFHMAKDLGRVPNGEMSAEAIL